MEIATDNFHRQPKQIHARLTFSEYDHQQHFELLLSIHRVGVPRRHEDGLAGVQHMGYAVHGHAAHAVQARHQRVAAGLVGADLLVLVEGTHTRSLLTGTSSRLSSLAWA